MIAASGWLWSGLDFWEWLLSVAAQTAVGFAIIAIILTPGFGAFKRFYKNQMDPFSPGGAGDVLAPDGEPMHEYLKHTEN